MEQDRREVFTGNPFESEMNRRSLPWLKFTLVDQQGKRWAENQLVVVMRDGEAAYLEHFSVILQAPEFDFSNFPFDIREFVIRVDLLAPEWEFLLRDIPAYSESGTKLGEEEWVVTEHAMRFFPGDDPETPGLPLRFGIPGQAAQLAKVGDLSRFKSRKTGSEKRTLRCALWRSLAAQRAVTAPCRIFQEKQTGYISL